MTVQGMIKKDKLMVARDGFSTGAQLGSSLGNGTF
jgi:hypothetical protein